MLRHKRPTAPGSELPGSEFTWLTVHPDRASADLKKLETTLCDLKTPGQEPRSQATLERVWSRSPRDLILIFLIFLVVSLYWLEPFFQSVFSF